jgi:hypothetical protein
VKIDRSSFILAALLGLAGAASAQAEQVTAGFADATASSNTASAMQSMVETGSAASARDKSAVLPQSEAVADPCFGADVAANPTRPAWDYAASTTQCGILETDYGFLSQPLGGGVSQQMLVTSMRYGLTRKLDLRWGLANHIWEDGGSDKTLQGVGDQWLGARFRFHEQGKYLPAMAFLYSGKIPLANPEKGLGSGFMDHQFVFIASRDIGKNHLDFNVVGTMIGEAGGHDGATQFGLALTRPLTSRLSGILESYSGAQPGTLNRFGAGFVGATYAFRPQFVLDGAFSRTYTAGSPRQQVLIGVTYARRSGFTPILRNSAFGRLLSR